MICTIALLASIITLSPQIARTPPADLLGARRPAISPDGSKLAFQYRGDVWVCSSEGGLATRLTDHVEFDGYPIWSPDGSHVAFSSDRNGNWDIFAIPVDGGETMQITYSGGNEIATDWSRDGSTILFTGQRDSQFSGIFAIDVKTLDFKLITEDYQGLRNPRFSPDGKSIVAERLGFPWYRPRYFGANAAQLVMIDVATGNQTEIVNNGRQHLWPMFDPAGKTIYCVAYGDVTPSSTNLNVTPTKFLDTASRTPNLWRFELNGRGRQVTQQVETQVRTPSIASDGTIAFESEGNLFIIKDGKTRRVRIRASYDAKANSRSRQVLTSGVTGMSISPDAKTFAFAVGFELWTVPLEKPKGRNADDATRITNYPGLDSDPVFSPDGKSLYFLSDREGNNRLYSLNLATQAISPIWDGADDAFMPKLTRDGTLLGFWVSGANGGLYTWRTDGAEPPKRVYALPGSHYFGTGAGSYAFSPDSRWVALTGVHDGGINNVFVVSLIDGKAVNVTRRNVSHSVPAWSADGKYLYFSSSREGGGYFILPLQQLDEAPGETELKYEKPKESVKVEIDFNTIHLRVRKFMSVSVEGPAYSDLNNGRLYFQSGGSLFHVDYDGKNQKQVATGVSDFVVSADGQTAFLLKDGGLAKVTLTGSYPIASTAFRAELVQDLDLVRQAAFTQFYRTYNRTFYDPNFHGRSWLRLRERYEPQIAGVGHRREFTELLSMMIGELEASHTEVGTAPGGTDGGPSVSHPGFRFDYSHSGPGIRVRDVYPNAPASFKKTEIKAGEYVMQINGVDVRLNESLYQVLHDQGGRDLTFLVNDKPTKDGARTVKYGAMSGGSYGELRYQAWLKRNADAVRETTNDKVGYVHIRGMGGGDRTRFEEEFHEAKVGKEAMIIDVRFNGGGNISDSLIDVLERKPHGYYKVRDGRISTAPNDHVWNKPIVVLCNENSFSNAEMFPYAMRERKLAKLVGMPTPGYVIWTYGGGLVDGTPIRIPMSAVYRMDGSPMENLGQDVDIRIPWPNNVFMSGQDPQLDRAIQEALKSVRSGG